MDLSKFVTYEKKESLLLNIANSSQEIVENTHSKPQESLEFKMNKQKESFSFDIPLELPEKWMMGVTSLEVYNTVYNISEKNNKIQIILNDQQLKSLNFDTQLLSNVSNLHKKYKNYNQFVEEAIALIVDSYSRKKKLTRKRFNHLYEIIETFKQHNKPPIQQPKTSSLPTKSGRDMPPILNMPSFEIEQDYNEIELPPGVYELVDINTAIKQTISDSDFKFIQYRSRYNINEISFNNI